MAHTIASVRDVAMRDYGVSEQDVKHFKAGANAAWAERWECDLDRAEAWYERKHGLDAYSSAARAFSFGWCWSAAQ